MSEDRAEYNVDIVEDAVKKDNSEPVPAKPDLKDSEKPISQKKDHEADNVKKTDEELSKDDNIHFHFHIGSIDQLKETSREVLNIVNKLSKEADAGGVAPSLPIETASKMACLESPVATSPSAADTNAIDRGGYDGKLGELKTSHNLGISPGKDLSGDSAILALTSLTQGVHKVYLYNSGFHLIVKPFDMEQLDALMSIIGTDDDELGKTIGYYRFLYNDVYIKEKFLQLLANNVISCNVKGWKNNNHFLQLISYNDYVILLWAMCCAMFKEPIHISSVCLECSNIEKHEYDITKLCLLNNKVLTPMAMEFLYEERAGVTSDDLKVYREEMLSGVSFTNTFTHVGFEWKIDMQVPMIVNHIVNGKKSIGAIVSSLNAKNSMKDKDVFNKTILRFQNNYTPWIKTITLMKDEKVVFTTSDSSIFGKALNLIGYDDESSHVHDTIMDSLSDSAAAVIGTASVQCSKCGNTLGSNGYVAWDPEQLFFDLTSHTLSELLS